MILAEVGGTTGIGAVLDDADAVDVETPDDRPAGGAGREARAGDARLGEQEIAELTAAFAADLLVRHDRDGGELVGHDRQHALLRCGGRGGCRRGVRCAFMAACPRGSRGAARVAGRHHRPAHDGARSRHGDGGDFGRRRLVLSQRRGGGGAEQEQACSAKALRAPQFK
ncbi:hypothetical protein ACVWW5_006477 [Bradyrhizobium sp. LM3.4]